MTNKKAPSASPRPWCFTGVRAVWSSWVSPLVMRHQFPIDASMSASSSGSFSPPSFTTTSSGSNMTGGTGATLYTLGMNYFNNGDVQSANDSVNGSWTYSYDDFNR